MIPFLRLVISLIICQAITSVNSFLSGRSIDTWYAELNKPHFTPRSRLFIPAWVILNILNGIALFLVWETIGFWHFAVYFFTLMLAFSVLWHYLFFELRSTVLGAFCMTFLWLSVIGTMISFFSVSPYAGLLLVPTLVWVSFLMLLHYYFVRWNG